MVEDYLRKLKLRAKEHIDKDDILALRGTKAVRLEGLLSTDEEYENRQDWGQLLLTPTAKINPPDVIDVTTWSAIIRNAVDLLRPRYELGLQVIGSLEFRLTFENCLKTILEETDFTLNSNCPRRLFKEAEEDDLIKSTVYKNNKNHMIKIMVDEDGIAWYMCAVYTGEIIVMLQALLDTTYYISEYYTQDIHNTPHYSLILNYVNREDIADEVPDSADEEVVDDKLDVNAEEFERNCISFALKFSELVTEMYALTKKLRLDKAEDIIRGIFTKDIPSEIDDISKKQ